jgi:BMFP domain-containing protein YqiC
MRSTIASRTSVHADPCLRRDAKHAVGLLAEQVAELLRRAVRIRLRKVDLVRRRDDLEPSVDREVRIRERLRLDSLRASTTSSAPSHACSERDTSYVKSTCPGVSIRLS